MKQLVITPKRINRDTLTLNHGDRDKRKNLRRLENILEDLDVTREAFVRRAWKRCYHFQLTYSRVFRKWKKGNKYKRLSAWFKRQDLYPAEVNRIVNMMYVLDQRFGMDLVNDQTLDKAIFLAFMLEDDLRDLTRKKHLKRYVKPNTPINKKQAVREFIARGFIDIDDYEDYNPNYNYVVCNVGSRRYYYPMRCFSSFDQLNGDSDLLDVHILQSLVGITGYTAVKYSINHKNKTNVRRGKAGNQVGRRPKGRK